MVNRTDRLYAIVESLRAAGPQGRTGRWLADRFEVTTRTVKRDVSALQQSGVWIRGEGGHGGGYVLDDGATLPPVAFTPAEAIALATAVARMSAAPFGPDGRSAITKILNVMTPDASARARTLAGRVWIRTDEDAPNARAPHLRVVEEGLRTGVVVVIDYIDAGGTTTARRPVEPMAFAQNHDRWYLMAWCRTRRAGRWFRLDRITGAHLTHQIAPPRDLAAVFGPIPTDVTAIGEALD